MRVRIHSGKRSSRLQGLFETEAPGIGGPSPFSLTGSIVFHGLAIFGLTALSLRQPPPPAPPPPDSAEATVIRIGDKLFFVTKLEPPDTPREAPKPKPAEAKKEAAKADPTKLQAPPAPKQTAARQAPKVFVPREIRRNLISESTLIQPLSPPDLVPRSTPLPTFRVYTPQLPRMAKQFIVPGRRTPPPPDPTAPPPPPPPTIDLANAPPAANPIKSALVLPPAPPPVIEDQPPKLSAAIPPARVGDPADILSLSDRPVPPSDKLVVPPGNVLGATGDGVVLRAGTGEGAASGATGGKSGDGQGKDAQGKDAQGKSGGAALASASGPGAAGASGPGRGSSPPSSGGAGTPGNATGGISIAGGGVSTGGPVPKGGIQHRPSNGTFDAVVVQSTSSDPFPDSKELLTGRPIYTVYVTLGTAKDWALYFCVPGEKETQTPGASQNNVVKIGTATPVQAPYPTTVARPDVSVPSFYKQILVHGYVTAAGRVENLKVVRPIKPETDQALLASLARWEFRPASRDGVNIGVEFVLSIPVAGL